MSDDDRPTRDDRKRVVEGGWQKPTQPPEMRLTGLPPVGPPPAPPTPRPAPPPTDEEP